MIDQVALLIRKTRMNEGDSFRVDASFVDNSAQDTVTPTTLEYRVDCLTTCQVVRDWTSMAIGDSSSVELTSSDSAIINRRNKYEQKQLTVRTDRGDSTQVSGRVNWTVKNQGFEP